MAKSKKTQPVVLSLVCEWGSCEMSCGHFVDFCQFTDHITLHLRNVAPYVTSLAIAAEPRKFSCEWRDCRREEDCASFLELTRHVYFHAFHAKLKSIGSSMMERQNLSDGCANAMAHRNMIPELADRLKCCWLDCQEVYDNPSVYYDHVANHADSFPPGNKPEGGCKCDWEDCYATLGSKHKLKEHLRSHTQEKIIACPTCGGLFANATKFFDHIKRNSAETLSENLKCSYCNKKTFATERLLRDHMKQHERHYKCPFCDMTCPNPSNLRTHVQYRHTEHRPFSCASCNYSAKSAVDLRRHEETHSKDWIKCEAESSCTFHARYFWEMNLHYRNVHQGTEMCKYLCHLCEKKYTRGQRLTSHLRTAHHIKWTAGHVRFKYVQHDDGYYRLLTTRYEDMIEDQMHSENGSQPASPVTADNDDNGANNNGDVDDNNSSDSECRYQLVEQDTGESVSPSSPLLLEMVTPAACSSKENRSRRKRKTKARRNSQEKPPKKKGRPCGRSKKSKCSLKQNMPAPEEEHTQQSNVVVVQPDEVNNRYSQICTANNMSSGLLVDGQQFLTLNLADVNGDIVAVVTVENASDTAIVLDQTLERSMAGNQFLNCEILCTESIIDKENVNVSNADTAVYYGNKSHGDNFSASVNVSEMTETSMHRGNAASPGGYFNGKHESPSNRSQLQICTNGLVAVVNMDREVEKENPVEDMDGRSNGCQSNFTSNALTFNGQGYGRQIGSDAVAVVDATCAVTSDTSKSECFSYNLEMLGAVALAVDSNCPKDSDVQKQDSQIALTDCIGGDVIDASEAFSKPTSVEASAGDCDNKINEPHQTTHRKPHKNKSESDRDVSRAIQKRGKRKFASSDNEYQKPSIISSFSKTTTKFEPISQGQLICRENDIKFVVASSRTLSSEAENSPLDLVQSGPLHQELGVASLFNSNITCSLSEHCQSSVILSLPLHTESSEHAQKTSHVSKHDTCKQGEISIPIDLSVNIKYEYLQQAEAIGRNSEQRAFDLRAHISNKGADSNDSFCCMTDRDVKFLNTTSDTLHQAESLPEKVFCDLMSSSCNDYVLSGLNSESQKTVDMMQDGGESLGEDAVAVRNLLECLT